MVLKEWRCKAKVIVKGITRQCEKEALFGKHCEQHNKREFEFDIDKLPKKHRG